MALALASASGRAEDTRSSRLVGVARIDISPDGPIRLAGYAARKTEATNVAQRLWAKAMAIGGDREKPALLITVDNCGVPMAVRDEVADRLRRKRHIDPQRVAICSSHTHSGPLLGGYLPNLFGGPLPSDQVERLERYTRELTDSLVQVAVNALDSRSPSRLSLGRGTAAFAANRRTKGGPVDHDLPVLVVRDLTGHVRALFANYACHCTTLTGEFNQVHGDWAGVAQELLERDHPGAITMIALGCGADSNPSPRPGFDFVQQHGQAVANGVREALARPLTPVEGKLVCHLKRIELRFDTLPTRSEWEARARDTNSIYGRALARANLSRLDRGETISDRLPYSVQTWSFGRSLAMVFLPGEVVVDYSLRLKGEFDASRLWVNAYANDVPCYIPSERILKEGGYEGGGAMVYYGLPTRLSPGVEAQVCTTVRKLLPRSFRAASAPHPQSLPKPASARVDLEPAELSIAVSTADSAPSLPVRWTRTALSTPLLSQIKVYPY